VSFNWHSVVVVVVWQIWQPAKSDHVRLIARAEPLTPVRVASVFADKAETSVSSGGGGQTDDGQMTELLDKHRSDVLLDDASVSDGCTHYEQLHVAAVGWIKLGLLC